MENKISALIIDDEKRAINILRILIEKHLDDIDEIHTAVGPFEGLRVFSKQCPDLVFLDIEMPGMTGFDLLEKMHKTECPVNVIFTTAYDQYAIRAIRFSAIDYLLKPIDISELKHAFNRFLEKRQTAQHDTDQVLSNLIDNLKTMHFQKPRLAIATLGGTVFFDIDEIERCEADNNYTIFHIRDGKKFMASKTLKEYDELLSEYRFLRIHQSHLVNPEHIKQYTQKGSLEMKNGDRVPVSRRKHQWVNEKLRSMYH